MVHNVLISTCMLKKSRIIGNIKLSVPAICMAILLAACAAPVDEAAEHTPRPVRVMAVTEMSVPQEIHLTGQITPQDRPRISFPVSGRIESIHVSENDSIDSGTALASIDSRELEAGVETAQARLNTAQANLDNARAGASAEELRIAELEVERAASGSAYAALQLERINALAAAGAVPRSDADAASMEADMAEASEQQAREQLTSLGTGARPSEIAALTGLRDAAAAELQLRRIQLGQTTFTAGTKGIVTDIYYHVGETYSAGSPFLLLRSGPEVIETSASRKEAERLSVGSSVRVIISGRELNGTLTERSEIPDSVTRTYPVTISLPPGDYIIGELADLFIETDVITGFLIPMSSVISGTPDYVYTVEENRAVRTTVTVEAVVGTQFRVSGLTEGQLLVTEGMGDLKQGERVRIIEAGAQP